ncbi:TetR/AcrR family transcriptional regulator [Streptomyces sp. NPDC060243]|uniref:TetR/AcrR family transcriptional regulator n=1 Tax=Streptomyces sp. NPDC060243 TaxID=3347081 RepID=UPI00364E6F63
MRDDVVSGAGSERRQGRNVRGQGERLRGTILDAVGRLLGEWGSAEKLTMRAVAKEAGISAPSIYLHFPDKAALVWAALADEYEELARRLAEAGASGTGGDPRAALRAQAHAYLRYAAEYPGQYRLMFETPQPHVGPARITGHPAGRVSAAFRAAFRACEEAGHRLSVPLPQAAQTLWAGLHGLISLDHSIFGDESTEEMNRSLAEGLADSLVAPEPGPAPAFRSAPAATPASRRISQLIAAGDEEVPGAAPDA